MKFLLSSDEIKVLKCPFFRMTGKGTWEKSKLFGIFNWRALASSYFFFDEETLKSPWSRSQATKAGCYFHQKILCAQWGILCFAHFLFENVTLRTCLLKRRRRVLRPNWAIVACSDSCHFRLDDYWKHANSSKEVLTDDHGAKKQTSLSLARWLILQRTTIIDLKAHDRSHHPVIPLLSR